MAPMLNTSAGLPAVFADIACSGAMKPGVPIVPCAPVSVWPSDESSRQAQVGKLRGGELQRPVFAPGNEDVVRLDVAVDDALGVRCGQAFGRADANVQSRRFVELRAGGALSLSSPPADTPRTNSITR